MTTPPCDARTDLPSASTISTFKLRRRTPGSFVLVACPQIGRSLKCQGQLEAATAVVLAGCPEVKTVQEQPLKIWYSWRTTLDVLDVQILRHPPKTRYPATSARRSSYVVPDFLVELCDGSVHLIEVKPSHRVAKPLVQRKLTASRMHAAGLGWRFHTLTEKQLLAGPLVRNLRLLTRYRLVGTDEGLLTALETSVPCQGATLAALSDRRDVRMTTTEIRLYIFHLLAVGRLSFDPRSRPLDDETRIFPGGVVTWNPFDSVWAPNGCSTGGPSV
jgi:hypothetical protein